MSTGPMQTAAVISGDGRYRRRLTRSWDATLRTATFVMLNPSTADATVDDPTIRRCIGFARTWVCGALSVVNLYALRATDPRELWSSDDPVGPDNDAWLTSTLEAGDGPVIAAWGANARPDRVREVLGLGQMAVAYHLGLTKAGAPRHPLYVRGDTVPAPLVVND